MCLIPSRPVPLSFLYFGAVVHNFSTSRYGIYSNKRECFVDPLAGRNLYIWPLRRQFFHQVPGFFPHGYRREAHPTG